MNRLGLLQMASCRGTTGFRRTDVLPLCQGVARMQLTAGLTLPVLGIGLRTTAHSYTSIPSSSNDSFKLTQFLGCRQVCYSHFETHNFNPSKDLLLRTGQIRSNFLCASLTSAEFWLVPSRPWRDLNSHLQTVCNIGVQRERRFYHSHSDGPGWEVYPSTFNSSEKTKKFVRKLRRKQRVLLMNELQILDQELNKDAAVEDQILLLPPSRKQLRLVLLNNAVPFIGFGFLDNAIMIAAGDYIDWKIGAALHISTMAAAGFGNLISDLAGVVLAGYVEAFAARLGIPSPNLSLEQYEMKQSKLASSIGRCVGIAIGCLLGMFPLLFLNTDRDEDEKEEEEATNDTSTEL